MVGYVLLGKAVPVVAADQPDWAGRDLRLSRARRTGDAGSQRVCAVGNERCERGEPLLPAREEIPSGERVSRAESSVPGAGEGGR